MMLDPLSSANRTRRQKAAWIVLFGLAMLCGIRLSAKDWLPALPGWVYRFPADHESHPDFKTEWWYFTGHVKAASGHEYGYELTFFREGVLLSGEHGPELSGESARSRFVQHDLKFAHLAISDFTNASFHYTQKLNRGAFGEAGFGPLAATASTNASQPFVWLENWTLTALSDGTWQIKASVQDPVPMAIDFHLAPRKPLVIEGTDGVSQKAAGVGNASHYYSFTRLATEGTLAVGGEGRAEPARGESWFDHEWASNQLGADQIGWNWFCIQFDDQTELMLYAMRRRDGSVDPFSSGTYVDATGQAAHLDHDDFQLLPVRSWRSAKTGALYPVVWKLSINSLALDATIKARLDDQELALPQISYWEGATSIVGSRGGHVISGNGYMELTGYAGQLSGLQAQKKPDGAAGLPETPR